MHKRSLFYGQLCYGQLTTTLLSVLYQVLLTAGKGVVLCVVKKLTVLDFQNHTSKVMPVTDGIFRMTTHLENRRRHLMENKSSYLLHNL